MSYKNKTNEELIDLLKANDEKIQELECKVCDFEIERYDFVSEIESINEFSMDKIEQEELAEKSFIAGRASDISQTDIKAWLNYKIGERI